LAIQREEDRKALVAAQKKRQEDEARKAEWSSSYPALIGLLANLIGLLSAFVLYVDLFLLPVKARSHSGRGKSPE
jgi:hypothetical protein